MKKEVEYIKMARYLGHHFAGIATEEEEKFIEEWKTKSPQNQEIYQKLLDNIIREKEVNKYERIDPSEAYRQFLIQKYAKQKHLRNTRFIKRSLQWAAILIFLFSISYFFYQQKRASNVPVIVQESQPIQTNPSIKPGKTEAILTLANGEKVNLNDHPAKKLNQQNGVKISMEKGKLTYNPMTDQTPVAAYNTLEIPRGGEYYLILSDGSRLWLNSETRVRYPMAFVEKERRIYLEKGEIFLEVKKDSKHPFYVECQHSSVRVLGTSFNILSYPGQPTQTTLVKGSVEIRCNSAKLTLSPGEQANVAVDGNLSKKQVDVKLYTSWKDGRYYFKSEKLGAMLEKLARWYNVNIHYTNDKLKEKQFTGSFLRYDDFNEVLEILNSTKTIKFKIRTDKTIEVSE